MDLGSSSVAWLWKFVSFLLIKAPIYGSSDLLIELFADYWIVFNLVGLLALLASREARMKSMSAI